MAVRTNRGVFATGGNAGVRDTVRAGSHRRRNRRPQRARQPALAENAAAIADSRAG